ncbi:MAG: phosphatase PAP2 family protein [Blastocatellia bacterium]
MADDRPFSDPGEGSADSTLAEVIVPPPRALARARWAEAVFLFALITLAVLALFARNHDYFAWDLKLARSIQSISFPGFATAMAAISIFGNGWIAWPLVITTGIALIKAGLRVEASILTGGAGLGWILERLLKLSIGRVRPSDVLVNVAGTFHYESFPSGHVFFYVEFFGFLFFLSYVLLRRGWVRRISLTACGLIVLLVGVSRVYLGAHWPSDVLGAYLAGGLWLMLMIAGYRRTKAKRRS